MNSVLKIPDTNFVV